MICRYLELLTFRIKISKKDGDDDDDDAVDNIALNVINDNIEDIKY